MTGSDDVLAGSSSEALERQHPPPQQTLSTSIVSAALAGDNILRTSWVLCEIRMVEARLLFGVVGGMTNALSSFP